MSNKPTISVIMPVYNAQRFLREAIESVLNQTFKDFEFIIINDGSTDETVNIIRTFTDARIVYLNNGSNLGLSRSFNKGIDAARGEYIARMDADDICMPKRFERQLNFLKRHPHVDVVGTSLILIDEAGKERRVYRKQEDHFSIKFSSLFSTPMMHPTVMGKASLFKSHHYNESLHNSEDYELWSRLLFETNAHFANIREPLLKYRTYPNSFTQTLNLDKRVVSAHNSIKNIERYLPLSEAEKRLLVEFRQEKDLSIITLARLWFMYIQASFNFCHKEKLPWKKCIRIHYYLLPQLAFLAKYKVKKILRKS